jgi:hypothetical protein
MLLVWLLSGRMVHALVAANGPPTCPVAADSAYAFQGETLDGCEYSLGESARTEPYWTVQSASLVVSNCKFLNFKSSASHQLIGYALYLTVEHDIVLQNSEFRVFTQEHAETSVIYIAKAADVDVTGLTFANIGTGFHLIRTADKSPGGDGIFRKFGVANLHASSCTSTSSSKSQLVWTSFQFPTFTDCHFEDCSAPGAFYCEQSGDSARPYLTRCSFVRFDVPQTTGGQLLEGFWAGQTVVDECNFTDTKFPLSSTALLFVQRSTFVRTQGDYVAMECTSSSGSLSVNGCRFENFPKAVSFGGVTYTVQVCASEFVDCQLSLALQCQSVAIADSSFTSSFPGKWIDVNAYNGVTVTGSSFVFGGDQNAISQSLLGIPSGTQSNVVTITGNCFNLPAAKIGVSADVLGDQADQTTCTMGGRGSVDRACAYFFVPTPAPPNPTVSDYPVSEPVEPPAATAPQTSEATAVKTSEATAAKTSDATAAKTSDATAAKTSDATAAKTSDATAAQTSEATPAKTSDATAAKTSDATEAKTPDATAAKTSDASAAKTSEATAAKTSDASAAKTSDASPVKTPDGSEKQTPVPDATAAQTVVASSAATAVIPPGPIDGGNNQGGNNANSGGASAGMIGGIVGGIAAVAAALIAFFLIKRRKGNDIPGDPGDQDPSEAVEADATFDADDPVYVSEYGLSDHANLGNLDEDDD